MRSEALRPLSEPEARHVPPLVLQSDWRTHLPMLVANGIVLRELQGRDAASLHELLATPEVSRFISPPPSTVAGFERFIAWTERERAAGAYVCFAVVPQGMDTAVGIFQIRRVGCSFETAEWGFAIGQPYWGSGIFAACAHAVVDFAIQTLDVRRLEARSAIGNGRGNAALHKIGAHAEARLRKSFHKDGQYQDQVLWAIHADDWRTLHISPPRIH